MTANAGLRVAAMAKLNTNKNKKNLNQLTNNKQWKKKKANIL